LRAVFRSANIPALIAFLVMVTGGLFAEHQNNIAFVQKQRTELAAQLGEVRARIEGNVNSNIQLIRGLVAAIATEPSMDQARFSALSKDIWGDKNQLRSLAAAPDMIISMVYPYLENKAALGLNYNTHTEQRDAALRVQQTGQVILAGPVDLVQGGKGFVARFPIFVNNPLGPPAFWGLVSGVIDVDKLYKDSGVYDNLSFDIAMRGQDGTGKDGGQFFGKQGVFDQSPVTTSIALPNGSWYIGAVPKGGWAARPDNFWLLRGLGTLAVLVLVIPLLIAAWLYTDRMAYVKRLELSESKFKAISRRFEHALSVSKVGVWENHITSGKVIWDKRMRELMGAPKEGDISFESYRKGIHPRDFDRVMTLINHAADNKQSFSADFRVVLPNGAIRFVRTSGTVLTESDGSLKLVGINWDMTADVQRNEELQDARHQAEMRNAELEEAKARIEHNALHDALTGLPNRRYLDQILSENAKDKKSIDRPFGVLHLDLDRFKQINDSRGHAAGDAMLIHTANVLREAVCDDAFVGRIGGDEFVIVCLENVTAERLERLAKRVVAKLREPVSYEGRMCRFGVSIGIELAPRMPSDPKQMLINADIALYRAKSDGRNGYKFFSQELHNAAINTKKLADEVLTSMEAGQFVAHYQPQIAAKSREIIGVEALVRWKHPQRGLLSPAAFMDIAEELNIMGDLDGLMLEQSLAQMEDWAREGVHIPRVAVNVSARRLHDENLLPKLHRLDIKPGTVAFELVESIYLDNNDELVMANLNGIRDLGIELELDDFGTGHTSIVSLMQLRPHRLKIDRQLVLPTEHSASQRDLISSIVQIGSSLGIESLAEGVESEEHARIMEGLGCSALQGFAFARPMTGDQVADYARARASGKGKRKECAA
jgi:diguanylate cyclase (GGDEF)-like protein